MPAGEAQSLELGSQSSCEKSGTMALVYNPAQVGRDWRDMWTPEANQPASRAELMSVRFAERSCLKKYEGGKPSRNVRPCKAVCSLVEQGLLWRPSRTFYKGQNP